MTASAPNPSVPFVRWGRWRPKAILIRPRPQSAGVEPYFAHRVEDPDHGDDPRADRPDGGVGRPRASRGRGPRSAPARALRSGPGARDPADGRGCRPVPRLLEEPDHRRDADPAPRARA